MKNSNCPGRYKGTRQPEVMVDWVLFKQQPDVRGGGGGTLTDRNLREQKEVAYCIHCYLEYVSEWMQPNLEFRMVKAGSNMYGCSSNHAVYFDNDLTLCVTDAKDNGFPIKRSKLVQQRFPSFVVTVPALSAYKIILQYRGKDVLFEFRVGNLKTREQVIQTCHGKPIGMSISIDRPAVTQSESPFLFHVPLDLQVHEQKSVIDILPKWSLDHQLELEWCKSGNFQADKRPSLMPTAPPPSTILVPSKPSSGFLLPSMPNSLHSSSGINGHQQYENYPAAQNFGSQPAVEYLKLFLEFQSPETETLVQRQDALRTFAKEFITTRLAVINPLLKETGDTLARLKNEAEQTANQVADLTERQNALKAVFQSLQS